MACALPKKGRFMNFSQGHSGTKVRYVNRACFPKEKHTRIHTKMGEIHMNFSFWPFLWLGLPKVTLRSETIVVRGLLGTDPPDLTSNPPGPPLLRGRFGIDSTLIRHRFDIDLLV